MVFLSGLILGYGLGHRRRPVRVRPIPTEHIEARLQPTDRAPIDLKTPTVPLATHVPRKES